MKRRLLLGSAVVVLLGGGGLVAAKFGIPPFAPLVQRLRGRATVADRVAEYGEVARARLVPKFAAAGVEYPPSRFILTGLKHERRLDLIAVNASGAMTSIASYPILAASGNLGPKLKEGDGQVPEGFYMIESLNPNSAYRRRCDSTIPTPTIAPGPRKRAGPSSAATSRSTAAKSRPAASPWATPRSRSCSSWRRTPAGKTPKCCSVRTTSGALRTAFRYRLRRRG
ncbi:MAG: hypothetical protein M5U09_18615 [Gammaproteobacteria bacterium]|nr:hypothetical protein [Gammaproteobacteria bacterium]